MKASTDKTARPGVIFDLDGTLWNSVSQVRVAWNGVFKKYGVGIDLTPEMMKVTMGNTVPEIGELMLSHIEPALRERILNECCDEEDRLLTLNGGVLYDGVEELLPELAAKYDLFIVSNCQDGYIQSFMSYHRTAPYFKDFECIGRTGLAKSGNISLIVERNGLEKAVYVGDTLRDMHSAETAGVPFIHAAYGFGSGFFPEHAIASFRELPDLLDKLFSE